MPCHAILSERERSGSRQENSTCRIRAPIPTRRCFSHSPPVRLRKKSWTRSPNMLASASGAARGWTSLRARDDFVERLAGGFRFDVGDAGASRRAPRGGTCSSARRTADERAEWRACPRRCSIPAEIGPYLILREVGRGGMGVVYQARHGVLGRLVALKMILAGEFASEVQRQRFHREAELAARVQHPQIVQVYEVGVYQGRPYLALEWCDGGSLADRVSGEGWPPRSAAELIATLAVAIDAAHHCGVVHRDLKPSNILLKLTGEGPSRRAA